MSVMLLALGQFFFFFDLQSRGRDEQKENKEEKADTTVKEEQQKKDVRTERMKIFEDSSTHRGGHGELSVAAAGLRIILPFRGYQVLEGEIVSLMPSRVSGRCVPV